MPASRSPRRAASTGDRLEARTPPQEAHRMEYRRLGKTGRDVSVIGFGAWAIGADWGTVDDADSLRALHAAADAGVNLIDTADVYGDGRSERVIRRFLARARRRVVLRRHQDGPARAPGHGRATRPRRSGPGRTAAARTSAWRPWTSSSSTASTRRSTTARSTSRRSTSWWPTGAIAAYGVSVEKVEEALKAIEFPGVATVQIIFNMFRQRPADRFLAEAARRDVGVLARVPLASGLLTGKLTAATTFEADGPSPVQPPRRVVRRGRDVRRRGLRRPASRWSRSSRRWSRRAPRWPRRPCAGS